MALVGKIVTPLPHTTETSFHIVVEECAWLKRATKWMCNKNRSRAYRQGTAQTLDWRHGKYLMHVDAMTASPHVGHNRTYTAALKCRQISFPRLRNSLSSVHKRTPIKLTRHRTRHLWVVLFLLRGTGPTSRQSVSGTGMRAETPQTPHNGLPLPPFLCRFGLFYELNTSAWPSLPYSLLLHFCISISAALHNTTLELTIFFFFTAQ